MKLGLAGIRVVLGGLFVGHGLQKLTGWFGGHGLKGTGQAFEGMGLRPGSAQAAVAGAGEAAGGALVGLGLLTPLGASMVSGAMITAIRKVHGPNGPWASNGGYEYNLVLLAAVLAITDVGPGDWSLDAALGIRRSGPGWALAQLAGGAIGSAAALAIAARQPAPEASPGAPATDSGVGDEGPEASVPAQNGQTATA